MKIKYTQIEMHTISHQHTSRDGVEYNIMEDGHRVRANPKPWRNKRERRIALRNRRLERETE